MFTCLVTGANGFLGGRITQEFLAAGFQVVGVGRSPAPLGSVGGRYLQMELPCVDMQGLLAAVRPEVIVHAAGPASVGRSLSDPVSDFQGSAPVLMSLLNQVRKSSPNSRMILISSAAVYGNPSRLPICEAEALAPVSPYGFHRVICEELLKEYTKVYELKTASARVFSAYGPGLRRQLLWDVCAKTRRSRNVELYGTGAESRDFIHVTDVARAVGVIAKHAPMNAEAYNVASGNETTTAVLSEILAREIDPSAQVLFSGAVRTGDPLRWRADIRALRALGHTESVGLNQGVVEYARWFKAIEGDD